VIYHGVVFLLAEAVFGCTLFGFFEIVELLKSESLKRTNGGAIAAVFVLPTPIWFYFPHQWANLGNGTVAFIWGVVGFKMLAVWRVSRWFEPNLSTLKDRLLEGRKAKMKVWAQSELDDTYMSMRRDLD
jgi:hypothetical protein